VSVLDFDDPRALEPAQVGVKAATLVFLARAGLPVPRGFVVTADAFDGTGRLTAAASAALTTAAQRSGAESFAVRSSATVEDLPGRSYAGLYETELGVPRDGLREAVQRVHASGPEAKAPGYGDAGDVAALVQPMLAPRAAGVAFTADPITGARDTALVHAVRGLGDALVSGSSAAEEWRIRGTEAARCGTGDPAISESDARAVAELARRVASLRGAPQDIEWALTDSTVQLLQARPMTALPEEVGWSAPPGSFSRAFRLGEWIGEPVTPLFESWLLTVMENTMHAAYRDVIGQPAPRPLHIVVNGWYYYSLNFLPASAGAIARMLPGMLVRLARDPRRIAPIFPPLARFGIDRYVREWQDELLPAYLGATARASAEIAGATAERACVLIDELAVLAGRYFTSVTFVAGYGWKTEIPLAQFYRRHLSSRIGSHPQALLSGLVRPTINLRHAVQSLDWSYATQTEMADGAPDLAAEARHARLARERTDLERAARAALAPELVGRFDRLLAEAQRAATLREQQVSDLTRPWPVFRAALRIIGDTLVGSRVIRSSDDVHFLDRAELEMAVAGDHTDRSAQVAERRARRARQSRLVAPLILGRLPRMLEMALGAADRALRDPLAQTRGAIRGIPASPGRATGRARIVRNSDEFPRLGPGEVLVCTVTTPAWTSLFARAAAVVTDVGSPAAHASIIAREYGIPAVVGTGDGTARIADGSMVTVDGGAGVVLPGGS
jgi:pyruvate,water dikinase